MSESADQATPEGPTPQQRAARRRRLAEVFGEVLPSQTRDDNPEGPADSNDSRLRRDVPPHH